MEIGLYNAKYPFRKLIGFLLSFCKNLNPNQLSIAILPVGFITAMLYFFAPLYTPLYWLGIAFIFLRMVIGTLDGLVAESFNKESANGSILNRLAPEAADMMLMLALIFTEPNWLLGMLVLLISWGISYTGLIGLTGGKDIQSVGPVGQTDRLIALIFFSVMAILSSQYGWQIDFILIFLWWLVIGGLFTIALRCYRTLKQ